MAIDPQPPAVATALSADAIQAHIEAGRLQLALDTATNALTTCATDERALILCSQCNALCTLGNPLDALRVATQARELALAQTAPLLVAEANLALSFALQSLEEHGRAIDLAAECEHIAEEQNDGELLARSLRTLGISYSVLGRHEQALALLERVIALLEQHARTPERLFHARYSLITARSRLTSGNADIPRENQAQYVALRDEWLSFVRDVETRNLVRLRAMAMGNAGIAARYAGDAEMALDLLQQTLELQYRIGLRGHAAVMEGHVGATLKSLNRPEEAIAAFKRAIELFEGGNPRELASTLEELAGAYEMIDDPRAALATLKQARKFEIKQRDDAALVAATRLEQKAEIAKLSEQWTRLASEDSLTGLANRRAFDRSLQSLVDAVTHTHAARSFALALFDLDHFKRVNDEHGHAIGDAVLTRFAALLRHGRRGDDLPARIGGEEFALLLVNVSIAQATSVVAKIQASMRSEHWSAIAPGLVTSISAGIASSAELGGNHCTANALLALADQRLYRAKREGRDRVISGDANNA